MSEQGPMSHVLPDFIAAMEREIVANRIKGKWENFKPAKDQLMVQLAYHQSKLMWALQSGHAARVTEFAADVADLAMKAHELYGQRDTAPKQEGTTDG